MWNSHTPKDFIMTSLFNKDLFHPRTQPAYQGLFSLLSRVLQHFNASEWLGKGIRQLGYQQSKCDRTRSDWTWSLLSFYSVNVIFVLGFSVKPSSTFCMQTTRSIFVSGCELEGLLLVCYVRQGGSQLFACRQRGLSLLVAVSWKVCCLCVI